MKPFAAPLDDMAFCLDAAGEAASLADWDPAFAAEIAGHFAAFAEGEIAPLDQRGDVEGCRLENGRVRMPKGFGAVYRAYAEQGWPGLTAPEIHGGQGLGALTLALTSEIFSGACHALQMVTGLVPGAVRTLMRFGTVEQQARMIPKLVSGDWLVTMCLTEPDAGSDLSRIRLKAVLDGGRWRLDGEKIFISGGDQDMSGGILHLVLARSGGEGVKGLSLFACPSHLEDGSRNRIAVPRIEAKMGLHASPTCQMVFDGAEAELIGEEGSGLACMFTMMDHARLDVALQGVAHAARAHDVAQDHAATRVQGRRADGATAHLIDHADVARMVDGIDRLTMGARAIAHLTFVTLERGDDPDLASFLTPLAKVVGTEAGIEAAGLGIQVLGGHGYIRDYRLEQTFRDVRITAIYEGANGIHERMLATRLLRSGGEAFATFIEAEAKRGLPDGLAALAARWRETSGRLLAAADPTPLAYDFTRLTALTLLDALWGRMAARADSHPDPARIRRLAGAATRDGRIFAAAHAERIAALAG